jgi:hypothetical protein
MTPAKLTLCSGVSLDEFRWFCYFLLTSALHLGSLCIRNSAASLAIPTPVSQNRF